MSFRSGPPDPFRSRDYVQQLLDALGGASQPFAAFEDSGWEDDATLPATSSSPFGGLGQPGADPWWRLPPLGGARDDGFTLPDQGGVSDPGFVWSLPGGGGPRLYGQAAVDRRQQAAQPMTTSQPRLFGTEAVARRQGQATGQTGQAAASGTPGGSDVPAFTGTPGQGTKATVLRWLPLAQEMSAKYNVPVEVILASIDSESSGDPNAQGPAIPGVGHAWGLLQAVDKYWGHLGNLRDPRQNLDIVVGQLMAPAWKKYQSAAHVRAVTYGGPGAIDSNGQIKGQLSDAGIPGWTIAKDVARYLPKVAAYKAALQAQTPQQPAQAGAGPGDLADLWGWLGGSRQPITGRFGEQDGPYPGTGHRGMDIGAPSGTALTSPVAGTVIAAGDVGGGYGNQVRIATPYGSVLLGHLSSVNVQRGQQITAGTYLGTTGNTGHSTGAHLHVELRDHQDNPIDPAKYYRW